MVERLRPKPKAALCGHGHWQELLQIMNTKPEVVLPRMDSLDAVADCHAHLTGQQRQAVLNKHFPSLRVPGRKYYSVNRQELFKFVQVHGELCSHAL